MPAPGRLASLVKKDKPDGRLPADWPEDITYLRDQIYSPAVTAEQRTALGRTVAESASYIRIPSAAIHSPSQVLCIKKIIHTGHPAFGQRGLFAARKLEPDAFLCLYFGLVHCNSLSDSDPDSNYDLSLDRDIGLSIDAARAGNESRCANDYRGIPGVERPNAEFRDCMIQVPSEKRAGGVKWERRVGIFVLSAGKAAKRKAGIAAGQEVVVSYGKGFWDARKEAVVLDDAGAELQE